MSDTLKTIKERYSCRAFSDRKLENEKIDAIALAAVTAPSALALRPWKVTVITDMELMTQLENETIEGMERNPFYAGKSSGRRPFYNAPCMIVLPIDPGNKYAKYDCGIVSQTIALAARALDVDSCIIAIMEEAFTGENAGELMRKLNFPEGYVFGLAVLLGYSQTPGKPKEPKTDKICYIPKRLTELTCEVT